MQQDEQIRLLLIEAVDDLGPTPDLTPHALKAGRRSLALARVRTGAISVVAAAAVLTPAVVVAPWWNDATGAAATYQASMPLHPRAWPADSPLEAPTAAFPVVAGDPVEGEPELDDDQRQVQYAFKQKAAEIFTSVLPAGWGDIALTYRSLNGYALTTPQGVLRLTFMGTPIPPGVDREASYPTTCPPPDGVKVRAGDCLSTTLADGTGVLVRRSGGYDEAGAPTGPSNFSAQFVRGDFVFSLDVEPDRVRPAPTVPTATQVLDIAKNADVVRLADFWARYPRLMDDGYPDTAVNVTLTPAAVSPSPNAADATVHVSDSPVWFVVTSGAGKR
ncbi:hypothetical protein [Streptodolium elevatio]|uniref:Uncharacterized protein n=1 Tax=Streptodolium elevatio TaxID=3157996 RepID=A0ABV3DHG4_9ACTN